jgi:polysaccharide chain length determinant protein (PEP-CTERM system associated)
VTARIEDRLQTISQQILSRTRLEQIVTDFNLYAEERADNEMMEDIVERMRRDVQVQVVRGDAFRVSYVSDTAVTAMKVTERLARLFIDENLRDRELMAQGTSQFINSQLEDARRRLVDHEKRLEEYRRNHTGELPTQLQANLQAIQNAQMQLQSLTEGMNRDRERRLLLERQLADIEAADSVPLPAPTPPPTDAAAASASSADQLDVAIALRRTLLVRLKPDHPDLIALDRRIKGLEQKVEAERASRTSTDAAAPRALTAAEILKENRIRDLKSNLQAVDRDLTIKQNSEQQLHALIASYQTKVDAAPKRESELTELTRDYTTIQSIYTSLLEKREASKLAANVERQQIGEQFKILDPARVPERPFSPNRRLIVAVGSAFGLGLGLAVVVLLEYRDSTFKTEDDIHRVLQLPVLAIVPMMASDLERRLRRRRRALIGVAVVIMTIGSAAAVVIWKLQGS